MRTSARVVNLEGERAARVLLAQMRGHPPLVGSSGVRRLTRAPGFMLAIWQSLPRSAHRVVDARTAQLLDDPAEAAGCLNLVEKHPLDDARVFLAFEAIERLAEEGATWARAVSMATSLLFAARALGEEGPPRRRGAGYKKDVAAEIHAAWEIFDPSDVEGATRWALQHLRTVLVDVDEVDESELDARTRAILPGLRRLQGEAGSHFGPTPIGQRPLERALIDWLAEHGIEPPPKMLKRLRKEILGIAQKTDERGDE